METNNSQRECASDDATSSAIATHLQRGATHAAIEERLALFRDYWHHFDTLHAQQSSRMKSLWGLIQDYPEVGAYTAPGHSPYQAGLFRKLLPTEILAAIERLWGIIILPQWPERIVTEPFPHMLMARAFGPALKFWHGCALTVWFLIHGPMSRTDIRGMPEYYRTELESLEALGTPINRQLFTDLRRAARGKQLSQVLPATLHEDGKITWESRSGFEPLRDIITQHRRAWTAQYFESYLYARWQPELLEAGRAYSRLKQSRNGKPPTAKQFAKDALTATNHWFGGNITGLYAAIGEDCPISPIRTRVVPADPVAFGQALAKRLRQQVTSKLLKQVAPTEYDFDRLAEIALRYLQLQEARGVPPPLGDLRDSFAWPSKAVSSDVEDAWRIFVDAIHATV